MIYQSCRFFVSLRLPCSKSVVSLPCSNQMRMDCISCYSLGYLLGCEFTGHLIQLVPSLTGFSDDHCCASKKAVCYVYWDEIAFCNPKCNSYWVCVCNILGVGKLVFICLDYWKYCEAFQFKKKYFEACFHFKEWVQLLSRTDIMKGSSRRYKEDLGMSII